MTVSESQRPSRLQVLELLATIVVIIAGGLFIADRVAGLSRRQPEPPALPAEPIDLSNSPSIGSSLAKIGIVGFADFECRYCAQFATETLPLLEREFLQNGVARFFFKHVPIEAIHENAIAAAIAAECAAVQGKFREMHDLLFRTPSSLTDADLESHSTAIGLDGRQFAECRLDKAAAERVRADLAQASSLGIRSTPTFLLGRLSTDNKLEAKERFSGVRSIDQFRAAIKRLMKS